MLETEQMPSLGRGVRCRESCASGQVPASPSRGPWPHGKGCRLCDYRGAAVGLVRRSDKSGVLLDVCLLERGEQGGQHRVLTGARGPLAQLSGQERSSTTMMGAWVPGRPAAAPGSSH